MLYLIKKKTTPNLYTILVQVPTKASGYTQQATQLLETFREQNRLSLPDRVLQDIFTTVVTRTIQQ